MIRVPEVYVLANPTRSGSCGFGIFGVLLIIMSTDGNRVGRAKSMLPRQDFADDPQRSAPIHQYCAFFRSLLPVDLPDRRSGDRASVWDMHYADVLLLGSPMYLMFALGTLPAGWLGDRMNRLTLIAVFFLGCGLSSLWIAL